MRFIGPLKLVFHKCRACIQGQTAPLLHSFWRKITKNQRKCTVKQLLRKSIKKAEKARFYLLFRPLLTIIKSREALFYQYFKKILRKPLQTAWILVKWTSKSSCGCNSVVEYELPKLGTRVRSPSSAPE